MKMRRVLHVIGKMDRAGAETFIMNVYRSINRQKVQFDFMVFTDETADYDGEIRSLGGNIYHMPIFKGYNYFYLNHCFKVFFKNHPYEIVHAHIGSLAPLYLKQAKKQGAYTIVHSHATKSNRFWNRRIYYLLSHRVIYIADYFMACSLQAGNDRFGHKIVKQDNFSVINNGIDVEKYKYSITRHETMKRLFNMSDKTIFGHVGRFSQAKNHKFLIDVFYEIQKKLENAVLVLVGRGPLEKEIRQYVIDKGLKNKVFFEGIREDVPDLMNLFDAFIFPSFHEGLGIVGIEAQAAGLPCFFSEGIVKEAIITDDVEVYSLEVPASVWANGILKRIKTFKRTDKSEKIDEAGFGINTIAKELEDFYLTCR